MGREETKAIKAGLSTCLQRKTEPVACNHSADTVPRPMLMSPSGLWSPRSIKMLGSAQVASLMGDKELGRKTFVSRGNPGWLSGKESACNAGDTCPIPGLGRSPGEGNGNSLQYSCLGNPMKREAWEATYRGSQGTAMT